jgi:hypothetical protein
MAHCVLVPRFGTVVVVVPEKRNFPQRKPVGSKSRPANEMLSSDSS